MITFAIDCPKSKDSTERMFLRRDSVKILFYTFFLLIVPKQKSMSCLSLVESLNSDKLLLTKINFFNHRLLILT
jgi:hypothetical protein